MVRNGRLSNQYGGEKMLTPSELIQLKAKVEAEMKRRKYYGSLEGFSGDSWKIQTTPTTGGEILAQQGKSVIEPLLHITDVGDLNIEGLQKGGIIPNSFDSSLLTHVDNLSKEAPTANKSSCRGACTGLCVGRCETGCSGCTAVCGGSCESGCTKACGESCGSCTSGCSTNCGSGCSATCVNGCTGCKTQCTTTCGNNCIGSST